MTDIITPDTDTTAVTTGHPLGVLEHLDPHHLVVEDNVRDDADLDPAFVANIKEHGVLVPIAAVRTEDGTTQVRMGQRRTLAARQAGLPTVPVYVRPLAGGDDATRLAHRLTEQIVENDHRREITESQRARGIQQLLDAGLSVTRVVKALSVKKDTVKNAEAVGKSAAATGALNTGQLSLAEAAALAEFEDAPGALERLTRVAGTPRFEHAVAQLREEQNSRRALADAETAWQEKGFTILDQQPQSWDVQCVELCFLHTGDGELFDDADPEHVARAVSDPAHWAVLIEERDALVDIATGAPVDECDVDWNTEGEPEATPAEGLRHANTVTDGTVYEPTYYCLDYAAAGLSLGERFARLAGITAAAGTDGEDPAAAEARAAAAAQAQAEQDERQRRERRMVLALNRLGHAAQQVRRDFVVKLLARKTAPKGAGIFTAHCLTADPGLISDHQAADTTAELLGVGNAQGLRPLIAQLPAAGDARAQVLTLGLVLGALEARTPKDAWRRGTSPCYGHRVGSADYLRFLVANGYQLADVERVITAERSADEIYDATLATNPDAVDAAEHTDD